MADIASQVTASVPPTTRDLRRQSIEAVLDHVEAGLRVRFDRSTLVRKRRSVGVGTDRGTWVRIEARPLVKIGVQGQAGNGTEAAALLHGIAKPAWYRALSWYDSTGQAVWRADETELVMCLLARGIRWWSRFRRYIVGRAQIHPARLERWSRGSPLRAA